MCSFPIFQRPTSETEITITCKRSHVRTSNSTPNFRSPTDYFYISSNFTMQRLWARNMHNWKIIINIPSLEFYNYIPPLWNHSSHLIAFANFMQLFIPFLLINYPIIKRFYFLNTLLLVTFHHKFNVNRDMAIKYISIQCKCSFSTPWAIKWVKGGKARTFPK